MRSRAGDGPALLAEADAMAARGVAFAPALEELASLFHRIAVAQTVPEAIDAMDDGDAYRRAGRVDAAGECPARLSDLRAGTRRPGACAGRSDGLLDDVAAAARVRAARGRVAGRRSPGRPRLAPRSAAASRKRRHVAAHAGTPASRGSDRQPRRRARATVALPDGRRATGRRSSRRSSCRRSPRSSRRKPSSSRSPATC